MHRHELSERKWLAIEPYTRGHLSRGRDNRLFVNAVIYRVYTGIAWRDLPERFGPWHTVARRFRRWPGPGNVFFRPCSRLLTPAYAWVLVDSPTVKAHKAAAGQPSAEALGRSRGGFSTKRHAVADALGNAVGFVVTGGHQADCAQLPALRKGLPQSPIKVVADKAYDTNKVLAAIASHQAEAVSPPKANRLDQRVYEENLYADRNKVERLFGRLKEARRHTLRKNGNLLSRHGLPTCRTRLAALTVHTL